MYKYHGAVVSKDKGYNESQAGGIYYVRLVMRPFITKCVVALTCPVAKETRALNIDCFDYSAARTSGALDPRGGPWYSRCEIGMCGDLSLYRPLDADIPTEIRSIARVSRYPAHCAAIWESGNTYQKLRHRPPGNEPSV